MTPTIRYRNTRTGRVVDIPVDSHHVKQFDAGKRWERDTGFVADDPEPEHEAPAEPEPEGEDEQDEDESEQDLDEPSSTEVRQWALAQGIAVSARGKLPRDLVEQYKAARAG